MSPPVALIRDLNVGLAIPRLSLLRSESHPV
jgi:hypothetical protein